jgi:hypothetical protein
MKKFLFTMGLILPFNSSEKPNSLLPPPPPPTPYIQPMEPIEVTPINNVELVDALIYVESRGNEKAYAPSENAAGCLQIRPIMVREVNRILKKQKIEREFTLEDRWDCGLSKEMFYIWKDYHHPESNEETIARNWNGGPLGFRKKLTEKYWMKVQQQLNHGKN